MNKKNSIVSVTGTGEWNIVLSQYILSAGNLLSSSAVRIYLVLRWHQGPPGIKSEDPHPSQKRIAKWSGLSKPTISIAVKELRETGLIEVRYEQRKDDIGVFCHYHLLDPRIWKNKMVRQGLWKNRDKKRK